MKVQQVRFNPDPTGSVTVQVLALSDSGEVVIGSSGGVPTEEVGNEVTRIVTLLSTAQAHITTLYPGKASAKKETTS